MPTQMGGLGPGSYVMTTQGELPVEWLEAGDRVVTRDHGAQEILWIGRVRADNDLGLQLADPVKLPVPDDSTSAQTDPLYLGPGHRVLLRSHLLQKHFHTHEALCRIADVSRRKRLRYQSVKARLTYHHLLLAQPDLMLVNGLWIESLSYEDRMHLSVPPDLSGQIQTAAASRLVLAPWEAKLIRVLTSPEVNIRQLLQAA